MTQEQAGLIGVLLLVVIVVVGRALAKPSSTTTYDAPQPPTASSHPYQGYNASMIAGFNEYPGTFAWDIVGESKYQAALERMSGGRGEESSNIEAWALVVPETGNPYDEFAMAVHMDEGLVGYIDRENAHRLRIAFANMGLGGFAVKVPAKITGGWKRRSGSGHFGVKLDLPGSPR